YIMVLPAMGVVSELIANFSRKNIFGYKFVAFSSLAIAVLGFLVWGHHLFVASQSVYAGLIFSFLSFAVAIPSAIKVFNWTATLYKASISYDTPMLYGLGFIGLFTIGGMTGMFLASLGTDVHLSDTYFIVAHFHYIMVGGTLLAYLGGLHYWWPKISGRMYPEGWGRFAALVIFVGFHLTFSPQFVLAGAARFINGGRVDPRLWIDDSLDLSDLVDALRSYCGSKSVASAGIGMANGVAAAHGKLLNYTGGNSRGLRVCAAGA